MAKCTNHNSWQNLYFLHCSEFNSSKVHWPFVPAYHLLVLVRKMLVCLSSLPLNLLFHIFCCTSSAVPGVLVEL